MALPRRHKDRNSLPWRLAGAPSAVYIDVGSVLAHNHRAASGIKKRQRSLLTGCVGRMHQLDGLSSFCRSFCAEAGGAFEKALSRLSGPPGGPSVTAALERAPCG